MPSDTARSHAMSWRRRSPKRLPARRVGLSALATRSGSRCQDAVERFAGCNDSVSVRTRIRTDGQVQSTNRGGYVVHLQTTYRRPLEQLDSVAAVLLGDAEVSPIQSEGDER